MLLGRWAPLNEEGISSRGRGPFAVVVRGAAFAQGLTGAPPSRHACTLGARRSSLAWWAKQGSQLSPEQGHGSDKWRSLTLAMASARGACRAAIGQQLAEAAGDQQQLLLALPRFPIAFSGMARSG